MQPIISPHTGRRRDIGTALKVIRRGIADRMLAGGFDSMINPVGLAGFCLLGAVSPDNDTPERASRPFDATRNGFVLGEGAGFLVLEEWNAARARGARIYAELAGDGNSLWSYRITDSHPSGDGPIQAMRQGVGDARATLGEVDYLNAHGTSTPMNDRSECAAVRAVWGDAWRGVAVSSTKSVLMRGRVGKRLRIERGFRPGRSARELAIRDPSTAGGSLPGDACRRKRALLRCR